jgi:hypothetical protein
MASRQRPAHYGPDLDLTQFSKPEARCPSGVCGRSIRRSGKPHCWPASTREEADRAASSFQIDHSVIYQRIQQAYQGQLELMTTQEALQRYRPSTGVSG